tara:strand:+ start:776 stop:994 length:219 start_codon:yes stop_codon:yes gene_type:complete
MIGKILQTGKNISSTGFIKIVGEDNSQRHPGNHYKHWNYWVQEYDPQEPDWIGERKRLTEDEVKPIIKLNAR